MPGSTNRLGLPYPLGNETADVAGDIQRLAEAVDAVAETPAGAQAKVDAHAGAANPHPQYAAIGTMNTDINKIVALQLKTDTRSILLTYTNSQLAKVEEKDGTTVVKTTNFIHDANGNLTQVQENAGGTIVTTTLNYANGVLISISRGVQ